jgi:hypothetical protein
MKAPRHKLYGLLNPLPQPEEPWQDIALDFIIGLPHSLYQRRVCDIILNVIDRYSREMIYISITSDIIASEFAELFKREVIT